MRHNNDFFWDGWPAYGIMPESAEEYIAMLKAERDTSLQAKRDVAQREVDEAIASIQATAQRRNRG